MWCDRGRGKEVQDGRGAHVEDGEDTTAGRGARGGLAQPGCRHAEADAFRDMLWAEAAKRERLLAEVIGEEEARRESLEELTKQHRVVFVLHREEVSETLEDFTSQGDRLVSVVPRKGRSNNGRSQRVVAGPRKVRVRSPERVLPLFTGVRGRGILRT